MDAKDLEKKVQEKEEQIEEGKPKNKKSAIKYALNISLVLIATGLAIFFAIKDDANEIWKTLKTADYRYLLVVVGMMVGCILVRSFILFIFDNNF